MTEDLRQREAIKRAAISNNAGQTDVADCGVWGAVVPIAHCVMQWLVLLIILVL